MRVTVCEACGVTNPEKFPVGWVFVNTVTGVSEGGHGFFGPQPRPDYDSHGFCSVACLTAYVALEGVRGETA